MALREKSILFYLFLHMQLGHNVRQAFLEGCDLFVDKTLHGSLKTVEECEIRLQGFSDLLDDSTVRIKRLSDKSSFRNLSHKESCDDPLFTDHVTPTPCLTRKKHGCVLCIAASVLFVHRMRYSVKL